MNFDLFLQTLPYMAKGLAGIFTVTVVIILFIFILNRITAVAEKKKEK